MSAAATATSPILDEDLDMSDLEDLEDFIAELNRDLKSPAKSKKGAPRRISYAEPEHIQQWFPAAITLIVNTQQCACGCQAQSVEGMFLTDIHRNGALREQRHADREPIPAAYVGKPRTIKEVVQQIPFCPACFNAAATITTPAITPPTIDLAQGAEQ